MGSLLLPEKGDQRPYNYVPYNYVPHLVRGGEQSR